MNTETKIFYADEGQKTTEIEIDRKDFLAYLKKPVLFNDLICNIVLDVATYDNLKYLSVYIEYNYFFREFLILNCDVELLIEILKANTEFEKDISDNVLSLFDDKDLKYIDRYINRNKDVAESIFKVSELINVNKLEKIEKMERVKNQDLFLGL